MRVCRSLAGFVCVVASVALAGCFQSSTLVKLNPNGSGTIEQTMTMNAQTLAQLSAFSSMSDANKDKNGKSGTDLSDPFSEADAKAQAAKMGPGVTFVSSQKIQNGQYTGRKAIYAFQDIRKLALNEVNAPNTGSSGMSTKSDDPPMTFTFKQMPNGDGLLTIDNASAKNGSGLPGTGGDDSNPQALAMMKSFLQGMKIEIAVQVGRVVRTNIPYVQGGTVTLLNMDFDKLLADPTAFDRIQKAKTPDETRAALKNVQGLQVNLDPQLTLEFSGR